MRKGSAASISSSAAVSSSNRARVMLSIKDRRPGSNSKGGPGSSSIVSCKLSDAKCGRAIRIGLLQSILGGLLYRFRTNHLVRLWTFCPLDDVKLHLVAFLECLVSLQLDGAVVNEDVGAILTPQK